MTAGAAELLIPHQRVAADTPYDVLSPQRGGRWRDGFHWPTRHDWIEKILRERGTAQATALPPAFGNGLHRALLASAGYWLSFYAAFALELALEVELCGGVPPFADPLPEHRFLSGIIAEHELRPAGSRYPYAVTTANRRLHLHRELAQTVRMRGARGLWSHWLPQVTVVSRCAVLDGAAATSSRRFQSVDASRLVAAGRKHQVRVPSGSADAVDATVADIWCDVHALSQPVRERLRRLILREGAATTEGVARDLLGVSALRGLPREVWSATASKGASRLIGIAVANRGGQAVRHGHGGETGAFKANLEALARRELQVATRFVLPTERFASLLRGGGAGPLGATEITGGRGDATLGVVSGAVSPAGRPKVLYVPTVYRRGRQYLSASLPSVVYLDWQHRLLAALANLPIELTAKLHPRDALSGPESPLSAECALSLDRFERVASAFDVLVFDHLNSTALATALCSPKRIVYLPVIPYPLSPPFAEAFAARCRIVPVAYDERNRVTVDVRQLAPAVLGSGEEDPSFFRTILLGSAA